ncbi:MAG TPA: hypothetical protein VFC74_04710 [Oscillospiraceae bacterium]|nr:hypothetical protein [Oscillospiraceae bacterium]
MLKKKQPGIYTISIFSLGLLLGLVLGKFDLLPGATAAMPQAAEGAILFGAADASQPGSATAVEYQGYLGVYEDHLAIYDGLPPHGTLQHVIADYEVRDDVRPLLEAGIPFTDTYDLLRLLENYTS